MIGIYKIENIVTGRVYIGQSKFIKRRWRDHKNMLKMGTHYNTHLQSSWIKHGGAFDFQLLEKCSDINLDEKEVYWINHYRDLNGVYNMALPNIDGAILPSNSKPCYLLDIETGDVHSFDSRARMLSFLNFAPTKSIDLNTIMRGKYVLSNTLWSPEKIERYWEKDRRYLYNKAGELVDVYETEKELKTTLNLNTIWYGVDHINYLGYRISLTYLGDKIDAYKENRGGDGSVDFKLYDLDFNLVYSGNNVKQYCRENGYRYNKAISSLQGEYFSYPGGGKKIALKKRWYKGLYWCTPDIDIKKWVRSNEWDNHIKRNSV